MKSIVTVGVAGLLVVFVVWWLMGGSPAVVVAPDANGVAPEAALAAPDIADAGARDEPLDALADPARRESVGASADPAAPLTEVDGPVVRGQVIAPDGQPVAGARVRLGRPLWSREQAAQFGVAWQAGDPTGWHETEMRTERDGRFGFAGVPVGQPWLVRIEANGMAADPPGFALDAAGVDLGRILLQPAIHVSGRVITEDGRPIANARVSSLRNVSLFPVVTDVAGAYDAGLCAAGSRFDRIFQAAARGFATGSFILADVAGDQRVDLILRPARVFHGRIVSAASGLPIAGAEVRLRANLPESWSALRGGSRALGFDRRLTSAADGSFLVEDAVAAPVTYEMSVRASGFAEAKTEVVEQGNEPLRVEMTPLESGVRLVPRSDLTVAPRISLDVRASIFSQQQWRHHSVVSAHKLPDGAFALGRLPAGHYRFLCDAPGYFTALSVELDVADGVAAVGAVPFAMEPRLTVRVVDAEGAPIGDVRVEAFQLETRDAHPPNQPNQEEVSNLRGPYAVATLGRNASSSAGVDGRAILHGLPAGRFLVSAGMADGRCAAVTIDADGVQDRDVDLRLAPTGSIHGTVVGQNGYLPAGATITAGNVELGQRSGVVDATGAFVIEKLPPGQYTCSIRAGRVSAALQRRADLALAATGAEPKVEVFSGDVATCALQVAWVEPGRLELDLRVQGVPYAQAQVRLDVPPNTKVQVAQFLYSDDPYTDDSGHCVIERVEPGWVRVMGGDPRLGLHWFGDVEVIAAGTATLRADRRTRSLLVHTLDATSREPVVASIRGHAWVAGEQPSSSFGLADIGFQPAADGARLLHIGDDLAFRLRVEADGYAETQLEAGAAEEGPIEVLLEALQED